MRRALSVLQIYAAETSALMKVLVSCTRITEQQQEDSHARFLDTAGVPSISYYKTPSVLSHGEGVELNQTSPLEEALAMALVPIRKLKDWTDPQRNWQCSAICKRRQPEQSFRGTSLETQATISARHSFCLCVRRRLVVWHMHINTNQNFSDKAYPVIPRQRLLSCSICVFLAEQFWLTVLINCSEGRNKKPSPSIRSEAESNERRTNSSYSYQCAGWQGVLPFHEHTRLIK